MKPRKSGKNSKRIISIFLIPRIVVRELNNGIKKMNIYNPVRSRKHVIINMIRIRVLTKIRSSMRSYTRCLL